MKKIFATVIFISISLVAFTQKESEALKEKGFKKENLFTGGNVTLSFFNGTTVLGISPHFGYSINKWLDAAVNFNFNYISQRDYFEYGDKLRQTDLGPGAFIRIFPLKFLYAQVQYEHNFINQKYIPVSRIFVKNKTDVNSLLIGGGYTSGRDRGENNYYYFSILFDVLRLPNSPYVDNLQRTFPIINAGINIALFQ